MSSIKCSQCNLVNWSTQEVCRRCGAPINHTGAVQFAPPQQSCAVTPGGTSYNEPQRYQHVQSPQGYHNPKTGLRTGLAITSMVLGILGFMTAFFLIGLLMAPVGFILGIVALVKAKRRPYEYGGKGFAIAGVSVAAFVLFLYVPIVAAIAIPNLLAARRAANEGSALASMRQIASAQSRYAAQQRTELCADLATLGSVNYVDSVIARGEKSGYRFTIVNLPGGGCELLATPESQSTGTRSFYYSTEEGVVRGASKGGKPASKYDQELE